MEHPEQSALSDEELSKIHRGRVGRYELFFRIGMGGMASVYLGRLRGEVGFERWVAIKQIHEHLAEEKSFRDMFLDEARVAVQLSHPNLVQVTDVGMDAGRPYLVMEFVKGETLSHILKRCHRLGTRLPVPVAARIIAWASEGLHHAHELRDTEGNLRGLVHRDLSPHNILVSYDGVVKVTDFGIAKAAGRTTHTRTGIVKGKPQYMSPEQALADDLDRRSDVFSLGILLFESTIGRRLFKEDSEFQTFKRITGGDVPRPTAVDRHYPPSLEEVVMRALSIDRSERYQSARDLQADIERSLITLGTQITTAEVGEFMESIFSDRMQAHEEILSWARSNPVGAPPVEHPLITDQTGSSSMSLEPHHAEPLPTGPVIDSSATFTHRSHSKTVVIVMMLVAMVAAVGVGALAVRLVSNPDDSNEPLDGINGSGSSVADLIGTNLSPNSGLTEKNSVDLSDSSERTPFDLQDAGAVVSDSGAVDSAAEEDADPVDADDEIWVFELVGPRNRPRKIPRRDPPARGTGTVSVMCTPWCEVRLDGRYLGRTPLMRVSVSAGRHTVLLLPRGKAPGRSRTIRVEPGKNTPISLNR